MNDYIVYLNYEDEDEEGYIDVSISADSFEIKDEYVYFKHGMQVIGFFKMSEVIGVAKE